MIRKLCFILLFFLLNICGGIYLNLKDKSRRRCSQNMLCTNMNENVLRTCSNNSTMVTRCHESHMILYFSEHFLDRPKFSAQENLLTEVAFWTNTFKKQIIPSTLLTDDYITLFL